MGLAQHTQCASCAADATDKCAGCADSPAYRIGDSIHTVYCSRDCQKEHWPTHKAHCRALGQRKKLFRAAKILKAALLTYRETLFDVDLTKIEVQDEILCLHQKQRTVTTRAKRGLFPDHLTTNISHKEAALANNQCTTAMALLGRLTRKLLQGVPSTIEVLDIHIGKPQMRTQLVPGPDSRDCLRTVWKVSRLHANEEWIIDAAGCQYGFRDVLVPYKRYLADKGCRITGEPTAYDATETKDLDFFSTLPFMNKTRAQREDRKVERRARLHFAAFVDACFVKDLVDGPTAASKDRLDGFVVELQGHMLKFTI